jgi:hypothetical protein
MQVREYLRRRRIKASIPKTKETERREEEEGLEDLVKNHM